jgi:excisionase family DNA binding protein
MEPARASTRLRTDAKPGPDVSAVPRLALSVSEACEALGVSWDTWRQHIEPDVRLVRVGRRKLIPTTELQAWLDRHAERVLP